MSNSLSIYFNQTKNNIAKTDIEKNLAFVIYTAKYFCKKNNCYHLLEDIIQAGNLGLMEACKRFDKNKGFKFTSYAIHWIKAYMRNEIGKQNIIKLPHYNDKFKEVISYDQDSVKNSIEIVSDSKDIIYKSFINLLIDSLTRRMKELLEDIERKVIELKYYQEYSFSEIGKVIGKTKQRADQIEKIAMRKLKEDREIQNLYPLYLELI